MFTHYQIDIADGIFVKNSTVTLKNLLDYVKHNTEVIPPNTTFEIHLMVDSIDEHMQDMQEMAVFMPIQTVIVHYEPAVKWHNARKLEEKINTDLHTSFPLSFGIALNPEIQIADAYDELMHFDLIQLMTVHPGEQGQPLVESVLGKITDLRNEGYKGHIQLDGAMNEQTFPKVLAQKNWPDAICPGSYLATQAEEHLEVLHTQLLKALESQDA